MKYQQFFLKKDREFWSRGGRKTIYPAGTLFLVEKEELTNQLGDKQTNYFIYLKPNINMGFFDEEEFKELFFSIEEQREITINKIL